MPTSPLTAHPGRAETEEPEARRGDAVRRQPIEGAIAVANEDVAQQVIIDDRCWHYVVAGTVRHLEDDCDLDADLRK